MPGLSQTPQSERQIRLGVVDVYIGAEDLAYDAEEGWEYYGIIEPGSQSFDFPVTTFELFTGHPSTLKIQAICSIEGRIGFTFHEYNAKAVELAVGLSDLEKTYAATPAATTIASATSATAFALTDGTGYAVGQRIEVDVDGAGDLEDTYIETIDGTNVTVAPALSATPAVAGTVKAILHYKNAIGGSAIRRFAVKLVFTDTNGEQAILHLPATSSAGGYKPTFQDACTNIKLPIELRAYGKEGTDADGNTISVVGYTYLKMAGGVA